MQFYEEHHALRRFYFASAARCASAFCRFDEALHRATATFIAKASARIFTAAILGSARGGGRVALHRTGGRSTAAFRRERSEGRNAAADRPPVRCSATRPTPRADPSERTVGGCFKKKKICRGPLRHIGPPLGQSPPSNIRPRSAHPPS